MRHLLGPNLFDLTHETWLPRRRALQPVFTKHHVRDFGGHMSQAADTVANSWADGAEIDLDTECRRLTLRALGRSVLGLDLDERADALAEPLRVVLTYVADRGAAADTRTRMAADPGAAPRTRRRRRPSTNSPTRSCRRAAPIRPATHRWCTL